MEDLKHYLQDLSYPFEKGVLLESTAASDPFRQFAAWFHQAIESGNPCPNAMVLSTATFSGKPSARIMLLRNFSSQGFVFYSNYNSRKAHELEENNEAALTFFWPYDERQVRIEGIICKQDAAESNAYFALRPAGSKTGAWASPQSQVIKSRESLDQRFESLQKEFEGKTIPRPHYWGGYVLEPRVVEFWQGRPNRLHDRLVYTLENNGNWSLHRLAP